RGWVPGRAPGRGGGGRRPDLRGTPARPRLRPGYSRGSRTLDRAGRRGVISLTAVDGIPEIKPGDDLAGLIAAALAAANIGLQAEDVLVVTQKVVSKAEGRVVELATISPRPEAVAWAAQWGKD